MKWTVLLACWGALLVLASCGIKPAEVDPPQGADKDYFPRTYPSPNPDPAPEKLIR